MTPGFDKEALIASAPLALEQTKYDLNYLEDQLRGGVFLLGDTFSVADAACFHVVNFLLNDPTNEALLSSRPAVGAWLTRIREFGDGDVQALSAEDALAIARDAAPTDIEGESVSAIGYTIGDEVTIVADDYGVETSIGEVTRILENEIVINRHDDIVGNVAVHYPRAGYRVSVV